MNQPINSEEEEVKAFSKTFILRWPVNQPDNVYEKMTEQDKKTIENKFRSALNVVRSL